MWRYDLVSATKAGRSTCQLQPARPALPLGPCLNVLSNLAPLTSKLSMEVSELIILIGRPASFTNVLVEDFCPPSLALYAVAMTEQVANLGPGEGHHAGGLLMPDFCPQLFVLGRGPVARSLVWQCVRLARVWRRYDDDGSGGGGMIVPVRGKLIQLPGGRGRVGLARGRRWRASGLFGVRCGRWGVL